MSRSCCQVARRSGEIAGWVVPSATLALLPKCPICVAGYIALLTGVGVSMTTAAYVRWALLIASIAILSIMAARRGLVLINMRLRRVKPFLKY